MKKIIYALIIFSSLFLTACDTESTDNVSTITNFAIVETLGDPIVYLEIGTTFVEPGVSATISGAEVPFETLGNLDINTPGIYDLTYQVVNEDGFAAQALRTVYVYESNGTVAGVWDGRRVGRSGGPILVSSTSDPSTFNISDILGGHYEFERAFGRGAGAAPTTITISGSSITSPGGDNTFGTWFMSAGVLSADEQTMNWTSTIPVFSFGYDVELNKITP